MPLLMRSRSLTTLSFGHSLVEGSAIMPRMRKRSLDAHPADAARRLEIAHDGARQADEARHVIFVVKIFPGQSGEIGRFDAQLDPQILCSPLLRS